MTSQTAPATRDDYLFGVCYGLATDFGINPLWLRALLAAGIVVNFGAALAVYAALGVIVAASRLLFRSHPQAADSGEVVALTTPSAPMVSSVGLEPLRQAA